MDRGRGCRALQLKHSTGVLDLDGNNIEAVCREFKG
jgi:hypothetical protein